MNNSSNDDDGIDGNRVNRMAVANTVNSIFHNNGEKTGSFVRTNICCRKDSNTMYSGTFMKEKE